MSRKLMFYNRYGVEEYYLYDPDENLLEGWFRQGDILDWIEDLQDWVSPRLGIRFDPSAQPLVIYRPDGEPFLSFEARSRQLEQERQRALEADRRAQEAYRRAQEETHRAEQERQRADRLAAHLASLGIDPDLIP